MQFPIDQHTQKRTRKRSREKGDGGEESARESKKSNKNNITVNYYFTLGPKGADIEQEDRDFVAQAMQYFSVKSKRDPLAVSPPLEPDLQGVTNNRTPNNPVRVIFKSAKHLYDMFYFLQQSRSAHHDFIVNISVDGSPYLPIL